MNQYDKTDQPLFCEHTDGEWMCCMLAHDDGNHYMVHYAQPHAS